MINSMNKQSARDKRESQERKQARRTLLNQLPKSLLLDLARRREET